MHIQPYADNAKKHPKKQIEQIAESIKRFGMNQQIVVDEKGIIIVGHGRYAALQHLGMEIKPEYILQVKNLTQPEIDAYRLADNKLNESDWDMSLVLEELHNLADAELQRLTGFDMDLLIDDIPEDDDIPDIPDEPRSKLGDIYTLGEHRVLCGDSTKEEDVSKLMDGNLADMVFTDPPWNVNYGAVKKGNAQGYVPRTIENDHMETEDFSEFMKLSFTRLNEASKVGTPTYVVMSAQEWGNMMLQLKSSGYYWSSTIIWNKDHLVLSRKDYHTKYEPIWYGWKEGTRLCPLEDRKQSDVWDVDRPTKSELHPTTKPIELVSKAIINSSKAGDMVLDLFLGSGSTLIAAEKTGRICNGMELDPKYCDVIVQRYVDYVDNPVVKLNNKEITWTKSSENKQ